MPPSPIRVYIAVIDGSAPGNWAPFASPLNQIDQELRKFEAEAVDPHYAGAKISYLLRSVNEIDDDDTPGIIAALVDGRDFSSDDTCPNVMDRAQSLRDLGRLLSRQREAYFREYGFRLWLVPPDGDLKKMSRIIATLTDPLALYLRGCEIGIVMVTHPAVLDAVGRSRAVEVANLQPQLALVTKPTA